MDEQSLPRMMTEIMVGCQSGNKLICYSKLRQGAKWIMLNDPPPNDGPSMLTVDMGTPVNDEYTHSEFIQDNPEFAQAHGLVAPHQVSQGRSPHQVQPGQGRSPHQVQPGQGSSPHQVQPGQGWDPENLRSGMSQTCQKASLMCMLYALDNM